MPTGMRARTELAVAGGALAILLVLAFATGRGVRGTDDPDPRASSFVSGREGVRGLADAAERLGIEVVRWRERPQGLAQRVGDGVATTVAVLAPVRAITTAERRALVRLVTDTAGADLVIAGHGAGRVMECFGYRARETIVDSSRVVAPDPIGGRAGAWTHGYIVPRRDAVAARRRSQGAAQGATEENVEDAAGSCPPAVVLTTDTLLRTADGDVAVLRLTVAPRGRTVVLVGDATLLRNRTLRGTDAAASIAAAVLPRRGRLVFDEYHQGFGPGGSMARVALAWSRRNPLGWMIWQLAVVALLALVASGVRFVPVRATIPRQRRSPLEHVRALATALSAARGHREAVGAMVRGLRRRLTPTLPSAGASPAAHAAARDDWREWLATLAAHAPNATARASAERLVRLADAPESGTAVLSAANAVEDLWHSLRP